MHIIDVNYNHCVILLVVNDNSSNSNQSFHVYNLLFLHKHTHTRVMLRYILSFLYVFFSFLLVLHIESSYETFPR